MIPGTETTFNVGGVRLQQPFKIRRLGHFGLNFYRVQEALHFYRDLLGFRISDVQDITRGGTIPVPKDYADFGELTGYFLRYAQDHHAFVVYNHRLRKARGRVTNEQVTVNQITWQVGSLSEVVNGLNWFKEQGCAVRRSGRDMPGSNWHVYLDDPDGHQNELYYGIEQVGWDGRTKPASLHDRGFELAPELPQITEEAEVDAAIAQGIDLLAGHRDTESMPRIYDVGGVLLGRPFKVAKLGPVNIFVSDIARAEAFYRNTMGFIVTEELAYEGHRIIYLRNNTEHHSLALYPIELRDVLGMRPDTTTMAIGMQVANYEQLLAARDFLASHDITIRELPPQITPGMDHSFLALDPDGHAVQFYWSMEQIGWDGRPRPPAERRTVVHGAWPKELEANSDAFAGEPLQGPW